MAQITLNSSGVASNGTLALQSNGTTTAVTIDASQNVGIGTVSPSAKLDVQNNGDIVVRSYSTNASNQAFVQALNSAGNFIGLLQYGGSKAAYGALGSGKGAVYSTDSVTIMADTSTGIINFATGGNTERARIDSSGNLLVGANSTFGTGPVQIQSATSGQLSLRNSAASAGAHWRMGPDSSANDLILYSSNASGGVYIGNASTSWSGRSDERLKDIIEPITDAANKVSNLRAVIGKFKTDEEGTRRSFLIAQDVQAVLPEAVSVSPRKEGEDTDYLGVAYTDVIPLLVAAIKEQQAIITQLQADVEALKGQR